MLDATEEEVVRKRTSTQFTTPTKGQKDEDNLLQNLQKNDGFLVAVSETKFLIKSADGSSGNNVERSSSNNTDVPSHKKTDKASYEDNAESSFTLSSIINKKEQLLQWKDMPRHLQFNPYIFTGYRPLLSIWGSLHSLLYMHNETINILTHGK